MSDPNANNTIYPQQFAFTHYPSAFSPGEDYSAEVLKLSPTRLLVILDTLHPVDEIELPEIASRVWRKRLYHHDPEMIYWAIRLRSTSDVGSEEPSFQRLDLFWDGERYSRAERRVRFNRAAFQTAFPGATDKRAAG